MNPIEISVARTVDDEVVAAVESLVPQLSSSSAIPQATELREIVESPCTTLLLARDPAAGGRIIGMLTLAVFRIPTGIRAWIEDVSVDASARGRGVGEMLTRAAIRFASERGSRTVELSSRPSREAANRLYQRVGFVRRETNVYRFNVAN